RSGVHALLQPVAERLFDTRATGDVLIETASQVDAECATACGRLTWRDYVRSAWIGDGSRADDRDTQWEDVVRGGGDFVEEPPAAPATLRDFSSVLNAVRLDEIRPRDGLVLIVTPSIHFFDGRTANEPWLQETPDPVANSVWKGYVAVNQEVAQRLGIAEGDGVRVISSEGQIETAAHVTRDTRPDTIAMPLGYGRSRSLHTAGGRGANPVRLLPL